MEIKINEIFHSIQGEGPRAGTPSVFVRFQGCQLACPWCDTAESLDFPGASKGMTVDEILTEVQTRSCDNIVITGGEPTLQMDGLDALSSRLLSEGFALELETNGLKLIPTDMCSRFQQINVGLKLPLINQKLKLDYFRSAIEYYQPMQNTYFKFVIRDRSDFKLLKEKLLDQLGLIPAKIILMPLGDTPEQLQRTAPLVLDICKKENLRFSPRLQITYGFR